MADSRTVLTLALADLRRAWRGLLAIDLLFKGLAAVLFSPLLVVVARLLITNSGSDAVADQEIISFLLSPAGVAMLLVVGATQIGLFALELSAVMAGASQAVLGRPVVPREALGFTIRQAPVVLSLAGRIWIRILVIAAPFLATCGIVYFLLLTRFDINFYLTERPPVFLLALALAAALLLVLVWLLVPRLIGWSFALPSVLFEGVRPRRAMALALDRVRPHRRTIRRALVAWAVCSVVISTIALGAVRAFARWAVPPLAETLGLLLLILGVVLLLWAAAHLVANVASMVSLGVIGTRLYELSSGPLNERMIGNDHVTTGRGALKLSQRALAGLLIGLMLAAIVFGVFLLRGVRLDTQVEIIAHRGASGAAPENTLAAFDAAMSQSTDWIELDVQEAADGTVVVIHDGDFMKLARNALKVWDSKPDELAGIDIGSWFNPDFAAERVPTLEAVLLRCKDRANVVIELKYYGHNQRLEERVVDIVERTGMQDQICVMSLNYDMVRKMKSLRPNWTIGLLAATAVGNLAALEADFLAVSTSMAKPSLVKAAHAAGKRVFVWTVNDPMTMALMVTRGADGLITDEPAVARRLLERMSACSTVQRVLLGLAFWFGIEPKATNIARDAS